MKICMYKLKKNQITMINMSGFAFQMEKLKVFYHIKLSYHHCEEYLQVCLHYANAEGNRRRGGDLQYLWLGQNQKPKSWFPDLQLNLKTLSSLPKKPVSFPQNAV